MTPSDPATLAVAALIALAVPLTVVRVALRRRTSFLGLTAAIAGTILGTGALGTFTALVLVIDVVSQAGPAHQRLFLRAGVGLAAQPLALAGLAVVLLLPPNLFASAAEPPPPHRWLVAARVIHAPLVLALLGGVLAVALIGVGYVRAGNPGNRLAIGVGIGALSAVGGIAGGLAAAVFSAIGAVLTWRSGAAGGPADDGVAEAHPRR